MSTRARAFVKRQWDTLLTLVAATVLSILSTLDIVTGDAIAASTLAVLALVSLALVKDREAWERVGDTVAGLGQQVQLTSEAHAVPAAQISEEFVRAMTRTTFWWYKGGTGIYLRAETLPRLSLNATTQCEIWIEIIDPRDAEVCRLYADYRRKLASPRSVGNHGTWSPRRVRIEAYATVIAAIWYSQYQNLRIHLAFTSQMSTFRYDMSDTAVFITNEDAAWPAIRARSAGSFYHRFRDELSYSFDQAHQIDLRGAGSLRREKLRSEDVGPALEHIGLGAGDGLTLDDEACSLVAYHAISQEHARRLGLRRGGARNPYASPGGRARSWWPGETV